MTAAVLAATADGLWPSGELRGDAVVDAVRVADGSWRALSGRSVWAPGDGAASVAAAVAGVEAAVAVAAVTGPPARCLVAAGDDLLVGTDEAHLVRVRPDGSTEAVSSFEAAEGRAKWYTPWGGPPATRSMSAAGDGTVYVNVHVGGILRSADGGASWSPTIDVDSDVHEVLALDGGRVVAATALGLAVSGDGGATWAFVTDGLHAHYSRAVAVAGDWLLLSSSTGPSTTRGAVYRRPVDAAEGTPFEKCAGGLPEWFAGNIDTGSLAGDPSGAAAVASPDGTIYVSDDAGASWRELVSGLGRVNRLLL